MGLASKSASGGLHEGHTDDWRRKCVEVVKTSITLSCLLVFLLHKLLCCGRVIHEASTDKSDSVCLGFLSRPHRLAKLALGAFVRGVSGFAHRLYLRLRAVFLVLKSTGSPNVVVGLLAYTFL